MKYSPYCIVGLYALLVQMNIPLLYSRPACLVSADEIFLLLYSRPACLVSADEIFPLLYSRPVCLVSADEISPCCIVGLHALLVQMK